MKKLESLSYDKSKKIEGGNILAPIGGFAGVLMIVDAISAYYEGVEEGCKCALEAKKD